MRTTTSMKHSDERSTPDDATFRSSVRQGPPETGLLVSVRSLAECDLVLDSPTPWIDLKEPMHGSLGRPESRVALDVYERIQRSNAQSPDHGKRCFSIALGEWADSSPEELTQFVAPFGSDVFFKIALAHCQAPLRTRPGMDSTEKNGDRTSERHARVHWQRDLLDWASRIESKQRLILCCYADSQLAGSPCWEEVVELSVEIGSRYILVDTYSKTGNRLLDWCNPERLAEMIELAQSHRLQVAVAGSLRVEDFSSLIPLPIAWVGVRGAVCDEANRTGQLCPRRLSDANAMLSLDNVADRQSGRMGGSHVLR